MKINAKEFAGFLKKTHMDGSQSLSEAIFQFTDDGLSIKAVDRTNLSMIKAFLTTKAFIKYENIGNVALNEVITIRKIFEKFGDNDVELSLSGNLLTVKGKGKKVDIEVMDENAISSAFKEPSLTFENTFSIPAATLKEIFDDAALSKDAEVTISTEDGVVTFSNSGKFKFSTRVKAEGVKAGTKVKFGEPLKNCTNHLLGDVVFNIRSDFPCVVSEDTENSSISIIVAPMVTKD